MSTELTYGAGVSATARTFTAVGFFRGVPFITQHEAATPEGAVEAWLRSFPLEGFAGDLHLKLVDNETIRRELSIAIPRSSTPEFQGMWQIAFVVRLDVFSLHLVDTRMPDVA